MLKYYRNEPPSRLCEALMSPPDWAKKVDIFSRSLWPPLLVTLWCPNVDIIRILWHIHKVRFDFFDNFQDLSIYFNFFNIFLLLKVFSFFAKISRGFGLSKKSAILQTFTKLLPMHTGPKCMQLWLIAKKLSWDFKKSQTSLAWGAKRFAINGYNT